jgi:hypothetical protein
MLFAILAIGVGLILALAGAILLDRNRTEPTGRATYAFTTACGVALVAAPMLGIL